ncbi:response regulator transcription factor [Quisquiliibacterium transsilvanicum]|jgi:DNA-binding NarL/FixJ family response regulator|uniref:DNA-binding NarL/FixJ family response regulator n=1 Tax=Quisquiliibacterium transsilvanicum TaxID=1549638 RepID=A0A7W8HKV6_9BURK|nr:response regulator transcription factor [Quisquiliibacterium transsilvanicum]MBB5273858.1 DNA-binding NarL/FixJ family response regulator [Quisquiliibacterium transsilvanicum]
MNEATRVVLADDHQVVRSGIRAILGDLGGLEVVGEADDGLALLDLVARLAPDLVITDLSMPRMNGIRAIAALRESHPGLRILVMSMHDTADFVQGALRSGADGYVLKDASASELGRAIEAVMCGESYLAPRASSRVLAGLRPAGARGAGDEELTPRQGEVLVRIARGASTKEIAFDLGLSPKTVEAHRARLMERLGIDDIAGLTLYAVRKGLVDPEGPL